MKHRIEALQTALKERDLPGLLVTKAENIRYISGFTGSSGACLVTAEQAYFVTDFRYTEQAADQVKGMEIVQIERSIPETMGELMVGARVRAVGVEKDAMTLSSFEAFDQASSVELVPTTGIVENLRLIKDSSEIKMIKEAVELADATFHHILTYIQAGRTELEVSNELEFFMRKQGATSSSFDTIVASGYRSALPHGVASSKVIQTGELVTLDFGALLNGYVSDITRTVAIGPISPELQKIYDTVLKAQLAGVDGLRPGITGIEADALTRDIIKDAGYGEYFGHSTGHGIGLEVHEGPGLSFRSETKLEPGMIVTVEPGIYVPQVGGCRIEDDVLITASGREILSSSPKELITL
ncbi:Xaa-Pro dipeptidase [Exiguobacterium sp. KRL4]|uniref:M24 family metallopeptidase n=1 Tax=Exiguobacterium sp. KRL4 TaxID=1914536 RepID=UPI0008F8595A|nr:Xaa-Pro peptidase family protein [Exiguobacterium sp. KRL4]OIN68477.1 Xaa-Pro dipeptidase [Exiguobacterium sp. KRL4]